MINPVKDKTRGECNGNRKTECGIITLEVV